MYKVKVGDTVYASSVLQRLKRLSCVKKSVTKKRVSLSMRFGTTWVEKCVFDMDNGHFEYGTDIDYIPY